MLTRNVILTAAFALVILLAAVWSPFSPVKTASAVADITFEGKTIRFSTGLGAGEPDAVAVHDTVQALLNGSNNFKDYVRQSTRSSIVVFVYRNINSVTGGKANFFCSGTTGENAVHIDLSDNDVVGTYLEGFNQQQKNTITASKNKQTLAHEFRHLNCTGDPQTKENAVLTDIGAGWQRTAYTACVNGKTVVPLRVGTTNGRLNYSNWRVGTGGMVRSAPADQQHQSIIWTWRADAGGTASAAGEAEETSCSVSVGGIGELREVKSAPEQSVSSGGSFATLAVAGASAAGLLAIATVWVLRRRKLEDQ